MFYFYQSVTARPSLESLPVLFCQMWVELFEQNKVRSPEFSTVQRPKATSLRLETWLKLASGLSESYPDDKPGSGEAKSKN